MILIITNKTDPHADAVQEHLKILGSKFVRINTEDFPEKASVSWEHSDTKHKCVLQINSHSVELSGIQACWYRKPYMSEFQEISMTEQAKQFAVEQSDALLEDMWVCLKNRFWINYPHTIRQSGYKMHNLILASELGFLIPNTLVTQNPQEALQFYHQCKENVVTKTLRGTLLTYEDKQYAVYTNKVTPKDLERIDSVQYAPTLFQEYIEKHTELRVTIVGKKIFACEIHSQESEKTSIDWRHYDNVTHKIHTLPKDIEQKLLAMMKRLKLRYGAFDLILNPKGQYVFLELNPNGQYLWIEQLTGLPISKEIAKMLHKASKR